MKLRHFWNRRKNKKSSCDSNFSWRLNEKQKCWWKVLEGDGTINNSYRLHRDDELYYWHDAQSNDGPVGLSPIGEEHL